jgi:methyl-accepting chemotaxis protein
VTKTAAEEINELASTNVKVAEKPGQMLAKLVPNIHKTAELVQEISVASSEQSSGAGQVNKAIQQLDQVTQQNAMMSESLASASAELAAQAEQLRSIMGFFRINKNVYEPLFKKKRVTEPVPQHPSTVFRTEGENMQERPVDDDNMIEEADEQSESPGSVLDMNTSEGGEDDWDVEFERY